MFKSSLFPDLTAPNPSRAFAKKSMVTLGSPLVPADSVVGGWSTTVSADSTWFEYWLCQEQAEQACQGSEKPMFRGSNDVSKTNMEPSEWGSSDLSTQTPLLHLGFL